MPGQANRARNYSGQADVFILTEVAPCPAGCWPDLDAVTYSSKGWQLSAPCSTCHREIPRKVWHSLSRRIDQEAL